MNFDYHIPTKLKGFSTIIWEQQANKSLKWQILPSGYVELVFRIGPPCLLKSSSFYKLNSSNSTSLLCGLQSNPLKFFFNTFHYMGVQMHPVLLKPIFGIPSCEITDSAIEGHLIFEQLKWIEEQLCEFPNFNVRAQWLENFICQKIIESPDLWMMLKLDRFILTHITEIGRNKGFLESQIGFSRAHTHRLFKEWLGFPPGKYIRLIKFNHAVKMMSNTSLSLTRIGYQSGFYDQAHFIRTFHEFSGMSPGYYRKFRSPLPGQLICK